MKALSVWEPWASLLAHGIKHIETRSWSTPYRGPLLIHAGLKWNGGLLKMCQAAGPIKDALAALGVDEKTGYSSGARQKLRRPLLPFGAIIGRVELVGCYPTTSVRMVSDPSHDVRALGDILEITPKEEAFGDFGAARFAWLCRNPVVFAEPYSRGGMQGIFDVPERVVKELK